MVKRTLNELNVIDDFLFRSMMFRDEKGEEFCRILLKTILNRDIKKVKVSIQKDIPGPETDRHGIRLDAYIEEYPDTDAHISESSVSSGNAGTANVELLPDIYDIEPNLYRDVSEAKRTRYYHALLDTKLLKTGVSYDRLQNVVIIMILPYDPFGKNRMVYTIKNGCLEDPSIEYEDGTRTIYLYTKGTVGNPGKNLRDMLQYLENSTEENIKNKDIETIHHLMMDVKQDAKVGIAFMKSWEREYMLKREGEIKNLTKLVIKKIRKNLPVVDICNQLETDERTIRPIYDVAVRYAPDYDLDKILKELYPVFGIPESDAEDLIELPRNE